MYFKHEIRSGIRDIRAYTNKIEAFLESRKYKIEENKEKENNLTEEERETKKIIDHISMRLGYGRHIEIFTKSAIVSIYTYLEFFLEDFCKKIYELDNHKISPKDLSGTGIFRSKSYLSKVFNINFEKLNSEWEDITKLNEIRNFLVHSNGVFTSDEAKSKLQKSLEKLSGINFKDDHIEISTNYISNVLSTIEIFLNKIESQYSAA